MNFVDESSFQGVQEFNTPIGRIRAMNEETHYAIYAENDNAFIHRGNITRGGTMSPREIYDACLSGGIFD